MIIRLGPVDAAAAQECTAQVRRAAAVLLENSHIGIHVKALIVQESQMLQQLSHRRCRHDADAVAVFLETPAARNGDFRADAAALALQELQRFTRYGGILRCEVQAKGMMKPKRDSRAHAQKGREFGRAAAGILVHQSGQFVLDFRCK